MVKFSKQLDEQLVPEWRAAYVTYKLLKKDLKLMKLAVNDQRARDQGSRAFAIGNPAGRQSMNFTSVQDSFVALTGQAWGGPKLSRRFTRLRRDSIVRVKKVENDPLETYETEMGNGHSELDMAFFSRLEAQLNKVNQFYRNKEKDFVEHADVLENQMHALIEMRRVFSEQQRYEHAPAAASGSDGHKDDDAGTTRNMPGSVQLTEKKKTPEDFHFLDNMGAVGGVLDRTGLERGSDRSLPSQMMTRLKIPTPRPFTPMSTISSTEADNPKKTDDFYTIDDTSGVAGVSDSADLERGNEKSFPPHMVLRMRVPTPKPSTAISMLTHTIWEDVVKPVYKGSSSLERNDQKAPDTVITKKNIQLAEKMLRAAFVEYYRGMALMKNYSSLNLIAFTKILKKYDKVSGHRAASSYLKVVETSYFNTSDKIVKLMDRVEILFTKHFASHNRRKAMTSLRPTQKSASHNVTFVLGLFTGGSLALLVVLAVLMQNLLPKYRPVASNRHLEAGAPAVAPADDIYFETIFPVFSMIALILIQMYMYGADLFFWRRMRINYPFIFEFKPGTELRHREVLMVASILTTLLIGAMLGQLALHNLTRSPYVDLIPLSLVLMLVILLLFPLNMFYRSSRVFLLRALFHILLSPLYKVVLADFFLADQLTSQVGMLRNMEYVMCFYLGGFFMTGSSEKCTQNNGYKGLTYFISLVPYWWRLAQCGRRYVDELDRAHIANGGKYFSALVAVAIRIQYGMAGSKLWLHLSIASSLAATIYQLYWDLVVDWGLLRRDSKNPWLRDQLAMPKKKYVYFICMGVNIVLRFAWFQTVTRFNFGLNQHVADSLFAALEIVRRGMWNFYRLENEHLNNVGKYRATKTVPLPFENPTGEEDE